MESTQELFQMTEEEQAGFSGTAGGEQTVYGTASGGVPEEGI